VRRMGGVRKGRWGGILGAVGVDCGFPGAPPAEPEGVSRQALQVSSEWSSGMGSGSVRNAKKVRGVWKVGRWRQG
jgi:hypothetical protein